jgi:hypothetical protein
MRGWLILSCTLIVGVALGLGIAMKGPALLSAYLPKSINGPGERIEGEVVRKQRDGNRLLVKITTAQGPALVTFTQKVADLDVLLDPGDTVILASAGYATFIDDPVLERVQRRDVPKAPLPAAPGSAQSSPR